MHARSHRSLIGYNEEYWTPSLVAHITFRVGSHLNPNSANKPKTLDDY